LGFVLYWGCFGYLFSLLLQKQADFKTTQTQTSWTKHTHTKKETKYKI